MILCKDSHAQIEKFLREHFSDESLRLPAVKFHRSKSIDVCLKFFKVAGLTLGMRVFIKREFFAREADGRWTLPGWLVVHEAAHVLQFARFGNVRFAFAYIGEYAAQMRRRREQVHRAERHAASYRAISFEVEAYAIEAAYRRRFADARLSLIRARWF